MEERPDLSSAPAQQGRCVACGTPLEGDGCCSAACAAAAERELKHNVSQLQRRRADTGRRRELAERNGRLSSALLRWRPEETLEPAPQSVPRGGGERILVVDDEPAIRSLGQTTLEAFGYRVLAASHGAEAVELFEAHQDEIAAVLTDIVMPIMDGYDTIRELRRHDPAVAIIATSGLNTPEARERSLDEGATRFLAKPYPPHTLVRMLADVLARPTEPQSH